MKHTLSRSRLSTDIHEHLVTLFNLVTMINGRLVVELGVNTGESTVALLEAVEATDGEVISVDIEDPHPQVRPMLDSYGLTKRWTFYKSDDIVFGLHWPKAKQADLIFVDTCHEYFHTKEEIRIYEPILRPGGIMVFHDTVTFFDGVQKPIFEFLATHKNWSYENKPNCNGLGILRKPS